MDSNLISFEYCHRYDRMHLIFLPYRLVTCRKGRDEEIYLLYVGPAQAMLPPPPHQPTLKYLDPPMSGTLEGTHPRAWCTRVGRRSPTSPVKTRSRI